MIVDVHVHLVGLNRRNGCFVSPRMSSGIVYHLLAHALGLRGVPREELDEAYRERLLAWTRESEVEAIGVLGMDGIYDEAGRLDRGRTHVFVDNDYLFEVCAGDEGLLPIPSINPQRRDALAELDRVVAKGAAAIKTLPNSQDFDPANPAYVEFWLAMAKHGVPLLTHTSFEHTIPAADQRWGKPERLINALEAGVTVIAAHCASSGIAHLREDFGTWLRMLRDYPNLYGDISAMASAARFPYIAKVLADPVARERVVLGSDFPVPVSPMVFAPRIGVRRAWELGRIDNPIQKNLETFRAVGVPDAVLHRGAEVLRMPVADQGR